MSGASYLLPSREKVAAAQRRSDEGAPWPSAPSALSLILKRPLTLPLSREARGEASRRAFLSSTRSLHSPESAHVAP